MTISIIEREVSKEELDRVKKDFDVRDIEHGVVPSMRKRRTVVSVDEDVFVGCASGLKYHDWFYLTDMWLHQNYRAMGIGGRLLLHLEQLVGAEGVGNIYTWTKSYEAPGFYERLGYEVFAEFENYYGLGLARFGFKKNLERKEMGA